MSVRKRAWLRIPLALGLGLLVFMLAGMIATTLLGGPPGGEMPPVTGEPDGAPGAEPAPPSEFVATSLFQVLMGVIAIGLMLLFGRGSLRSFGFRWPSRAPSRAPWRAVVIAVLVAEVAITLAFLPFKGEGEGHFAAGFAWWETLIGVFLIASTLEEVVARGLVQGLLRPLREAKLNLGLTVLSVPVLTGALYFSAMHVPLLVMGIETVQGIQILVATFVLGCIAGKALEISGSLVPAVAAHMLANAAGMGVGWVLGLAGLA